MKITENNKHTSTCDVLYPSLSQVDLLLFIVTV